MQNKVLQIEYQVFETLSELSSEFQQLIAKANSALLRAYAPYSNFMVGAAVLLDNGTIIEGNNQENVAYPSGLCAERVALFYANSKFPNNKIKALAIIAKNKMDRQEDMIITPCGACRQVMIEVEYRQKEPIIIILTSQNKKGFIFEGTEKLLPFSFNSSKFL